MLVLSAKKVAEIMNVDVETVRSLMRRGAISCTTRRELLQTQSDELVTTPIAVIDFIAERFGLEKNEAREYYSQYFKKTEKE